MSVDFSAIKIEHPNKAVKIEKKEEMHKMADLILSLKDHGGMQMLQQELIGKIQAINIALINEEIGECRCMERAKMFEARKCWRYLLSIFPNADRVKKSIEDEMKKYV